MSDGTTNQFRCDAAARIATSTQTTDGVSYPFTYAYYMDGSVASVQYTSGRWVRYTPEVAGRLTQVAGTLGGASKSYVSAMTYNEQGLMAATALGNGLTERWSYNAQRLQPYDVRLGTAGNEISHFALKFAYCASNDSGGSCAANNGNIVAQWNYTNNHIEQYGYDAVNRLASAADYAAPNEWSQSYGYDRFGNRWVSANGTLPMDPRTPDSQSDINAANNRLTGANYAYDAAGNQTKYGGWTLGYDAENRLVSSQPSGGSVTTYAYDGDGRRVKKTTGGVSTVYVYGADGELAAEYGGAAQTAGTHFLTSDHLGSTRLVTDASGNVVSRHDYLPFGEEIPAGVGGRTTGMGYVANPAVTQKFTGKERDGETGLDYFGARYLSGVLGRFTSADLPLLGSLENPQTWNLYSYTANNPLSRVDPDGRNWFQINGNWEWHEGDTYDPDGEKGKQKPIKSIYTHLLVFQQTGTNRSGSATGTLTLYDQNKVVATSPAFSGGAEDKGPIAGGTFMIRPGLRDTVDISDLTVLPGGGGAPRENAGKTGTGYAFTFRENGDRLRFRFL